MKITNVMRYFPRAAAVSILLCVALVVSLLPMLPISAQGLVLDRTLINETIDDNLEDFEPGSFYRTALQRASVLQGSDFDVNNRDATIELARIGKMEPFKTANFQLPRKLFQMGAASLQNNSGENRFFVLGGQTPTEDGTSTEPVAEVWSAVLSSTRDLEDGTLLGTSIVGDEWEDEFALPATVPNFSGAAEEEVETATHSPAVAVMDNEFGDDYIYVIGGMSTRGADSFSLYSVRIAVVDGTTGKIREWIVSDTEGADGVDTLPPSVNAGKSTSNMRVPTSSDFGGLISVYGAFGAMAATVTMTETNTTYLYLMGGTRQYVDRDNGVTQTEPSKEVFYARLGPDGRPYKPSTTGNSTENVGWEALENIPLPDDGDQEGLFYSSLISSESIFGLKALYLVGGETTTAGGGQNTAVVYRALVNPNGTLTWQGINPETSGSEITGTMPNPLSAHTAMELDNRIYVVGGLVYKNQGGQRVAEPVRTGMLGYFRDDLELNDFNPGGEPLYFQVPAEDAPPREQALLDPRAYHASVIVDAGEGSQFLYVFGGIGITENLDVTGSDAVRVYRVRDDFSEAQDPSYASTGWFVSRPYPLKQQDPRVEQMSWNVEFPGGKGTMELVMQYRTAPQLNCENPLWSEWKPDAAEETWTSEQGFNEYDLEPETGVKCFQYRARFVASGSLKESPRLQKVGIKIFVPGGPDVHTDDRRPDGGFDVKWLNEGSNLLADFSGVDIYLTNHYANETEDEPTLAADVAAPGEGGFYADLFIIGPGYNERVITPTLPMSSTMYTDGDSVLSSTMYLELRKVDFPAVDPPISYLVASDAWCISPNGPCNQNIRDMITEGGEYTFCVAVDSYVDDPVANPLGLINEVLEGAEDNNFRCSEPVTIEDKPVDPPTVTLGSLGGGPGVTNVVTEGQTLNLFELSWQPAQNEPVTITFGLEGSALAGSDYTVFVGNPGNVVTNTMVLPARENSLILGVSAVHEGEVEGNEDFTLSLQDGEDRYSLGDISSEQVTILDIDRIPIVYMPLVMR